jgi:hypothetical protein
MAIPRLTAGKRLRSVSCTSEGCAWAI